MFLRFVINALFYALFNIIFLYTVFASNVIQESSEIDLKNNSIQNEDLINNILNYSNNSLVYGKSIKINILNKLVAKTSSKIFNIDKAYFIGNLAVTAHRCIKNQNEYFQEDYFLISVVEHNLRYDPKVIFFGWLFSSSPSLNLVEHQIYQILPQTCVIEEM